jgi:hypothetical protein
LWRNCVNNFNDLKEMQKFLETSKCYSGKYRESELTNCNIK